MRKAIVAGITALIIGLGINASAAETTDVPKVNYNNYSGDIVISGDAKNGSYITLKILKLGEDYDALESLTAEDSIFYCDQITAGEEGYSFEFNFGGESGNYKATVSDATERTVEKFQFGITRPEDYGDAVILLNTTANTSYDEFVKVMSEQRTALGFEYSLESSDESTENFYNYVKKNNLKPSEFDDNVKIYRSFVLMTQADSGKLEDITNHIDDIYFTNSDLKQELLSVTELNSKVGEYMTGKLTGTDMNSLEDLNTELETAYVLGAVMYANGYGSIVDALESYGKNVGITGKISTRACQKLSGNDYDADEIGKAYKNFATDNSGSGTGSGSGGSSGGGGGFGSSDNRTGLSSSGASSIMGSGTPETKVETEYIFTDLSENHWAAEAVAWLKDRGIVSGTDTGAFEPDRAVTREEFTKMIVLACGFEETESVNFTDVESGAWYAPYIGAAAECGVVTGIGDNMFGVGRNIIRQDMSVMVNRAINTKSVKLDKIREYNEFADESDIADYASESVKMLYESGIINGKGGNLFDPMGNATRAEAAKIIFEAFKGGMA